MPNYWSKEWKSIAEAINLNTKLHLESIGTGKDTVHDEVGAPRISFFDITLKSNNQVIKILNLDSPIFLFCERIHHPL